MNAYRINGDALPLGADNLLDLCLRLHMAGNGSADPLTVPETHAVLAYLRRRLTHWTPSPSFSKAFDDAVRKLVIAAHDEAEARSDGALFDYRQAGHGIPLVLHEGGAACLSCQSYWPKDPSRVGMPCGNFLCPDRRVGDAAGGGQ